MLRGRLGEAVEWWERWLEIAKATGVDGRERDRVRRAMMAARDLDAAVKVTHG